ncbi:MAG: hypothetical protein E3K37_06005 [Candidatus Kuenenia sp.]|nr:hypothetical protein [Candidatus Kuenenia hertensis]
MIKAIEQISYTIAPEAFYSVENSCPEVTLFEPEYLPFKFKQSAFGEAIYDKETKRFKAVPKHYSECAEFSEYLFHKIEHHKLMET